MKVSLLHSISLVAVLAIATPVHAADPVVADINGHKITYSQVMAAKADLPKKYQSKSDDELFTALVEQAVDSYLIEKAATAADVGNKPEVKKALEKAKESILVQAYLLEKIKDKVTDAKVKAKYEEVVKNYPKEDEIHLRHILVDKKEIAQSVIKALKNGTDFKKLAQSKSKDGTAKEGGDLGFFRKSELPQELADAAFALKPGAYSEEPVKTDFGWHVLMVEQIRPATPPKLDDIQNELKAYLTQEEIAAVVKSLRSEAKVALFDKNGKPLPAKAKEEKAAPAAAEKPEGEPKK